MEKGFIDFINELKLYCENQQEKEIEEIVDYSQALKACYYISHLEPKSIGDLLLYCGSLSLMNRYVKQKDSKFYKKYFFKNYGLNRLIGILNKIPYIEGFEMKYETDNNTPLIYTSICGLHFCFHSVKKELKDKIPEKYLGDFKWDGIKKQKCAHSLFNKIEDNDILLTQTYLREEARMKADEVLSGKISKNDFINECGFFNKCIN